MAGGVLFPGFGSWFRDFPVPGMMGFLFLSFLSIPVSSIWQFIRRSPGLIVYLVFTKLIVLPVAVFFLFEQLLPKYALAALLLSGITPAVLSPLFAEMLSANAPFVVVGVVTSSFLIPFTLPVLVKILAGRTMFISFIAMVRILSLVVFIPFVLAEVVKRCSPPAARRILAIRYPASLLIVSLQMLGIFSGYSDTLSPAELDDWNCRGGFHRPGRTPLSGGTIAVLANAGARTAHLPDQLRAD